ncbi:MAG: hypothetical protein GY792_10155 [Gammaproteobacteria bacterium]|nr:hypothetical protein [Gammaproteobacteria bacterium]
MNKTEQIIQFAIDRKIGLNFDSDRPAIEAALGPPEWPDDQYLLWGDLEIGLLPKGENIPFRNVGYFKFCLGNTGRNKFSIPGFVDVKFGVSDIDMREVLNVLVDRSIWFEHISVNAGLKLHRAPE